MINKNNNNLVKISISWPILYSIFKLKLMWIFYINILIRISNTIKFNFIIYTIILLVQLILNKYIFSLNKKSRFKNSQNPLQIPLQNPL